VNKFEGDAALCVFGAPVPLDDPATAALRAARRIRDEVYERGEVEVGMGVASGPVIAGQIGAPSRLEYTVIGDAVNVAARLCSQAGPGEILIAEPLHAVLSQPPPVSSLTPVPLRGKSRPVPVYRIEWQDVVIETEITGNRPVTTL
jgi:adenylate cyclase